MILALSRLLLLNGNKKIIIRIFYRNIAFLIFLTVGLVCYAQVDTTTIHKINGKEYFIHTVEAGNTLYSISKVYNTPVEIIKKENPSVADGLSIGERIFILKKKEEQVFVDGNFITHEVEKGRTLYSLAKEYGVKQKDIVALNTDLEKGSLSEGQVVKIPVKVLKDNSKPKEEKPKGNFKIHVVKKGETLYSLSNIYQVSIDSIKLVNNGLIQGLKLGERIYIPVKEKKKKAHEMNINQFLTGNDPISVDSVNIHSILGDSINFNGVFKIALLLPFYVEENNEIVENLNAIDKKKLFPKSKYAVEFYQGFLLALENLSSDSLKFQLQVFDTKGNDTSAVSKLIREDKIDANLIVGPLYPVNFALMANYAKENGIRIVSPVKVPNKLLLGNEMVYKVIPSSTTLVGNIASFVVDSFPNSNVVAVQHKDSKEKTLADIFEREYNSKVLDKQDTLLVSPINKVGISTPAELVKFIDKNKHNVLYIPSNNSSFVTNLFITLANTIYSKDYENCKISLIGTEVWKNYENIDLEYFDTLDVHLPISNYIDYSSETIKEIISNYSKQFESYPSSHSFLAFDIANYFVSQLVFHKNDYQSISQPFGYIKTGLESGYENAESFIVRFTDSSIQKVY